MATAASSAPDLRPLRIGEILDVAIKVYSGNLGTLFKLVAIVVVPIQVVGVLLILSSTPDSLAQLQRDPFSTDPATQVPQVDAGDFGIFFAANALIFVLTFIGTTLATGATFKAITDAYLGIRPEWRSSLRFALSHLRSLVWVTFLSGLLAILGLVFCVIPGVWLWAAWAVVTPVLLTEGVKGTKALGRSFNLTQGRWWPTFTVLVLAFLLVFVISGVVGGGVTALSFTDVGRNIVLVQVLNGFGTTIASVVATPFQAAVITILYFDLRVRKEGFDLALLAQRIGTEIPEGARPALIPPPAPPPLNAPPSGAGSIAGSGTPAPPSGPGVAPGPPAPGTYPQGFSVAPPTNGKAVAALITGILGLTCLFGIAGIAALILGYSARSDIDRNPAQQGRGMAVGGIVMGWIGITLGALIAILAIAA